MSNANVDALLEALKVPRLKFANQLRPHSRCPYCSTPNPTYEIAWRSSGLTLRASPGPRHGWGLYLCITCGGAIIAKGAQGDDSSSAAIIELIPAARSVPEDVPQTARIFLQQAMDTLHAPDAAAVMAGSAIDAMLKYLGYETGSVYSRIDQAVAEHKITKAMGDWAHEVRLNSNRPRHADSERPHVLPEEAVQSVEFAEALAHFVFVLNNRITRGKQAAVEASVNEAER